MDGSIYYGQTRGGNREGYGIVINSDGCYDGYWIEDKAHGKGIFNYYNGDSYQGDWEFDKPNGFGIFKDKNGSIYSGNF